MMTLPVFGDELHRYAKVNELIMNTYKQTCVSPNYRKFIKEMQVTEWESVEGGKFETTFFFCTTFVTVTNKRFRDIKNNS